MINLDKYPSIFIANWKLNGNYSFLKDYYEKLKVNSNNCTIICSTSIYLKSLKGNDDNLFCGAQDVSSYKDGAYTGELSASMLKDNNIDFCLVGHSERRQHFAETNNSVNIKSSNLIEENIIPVICIGETLEQKENNLTEEILFTQIKDSVPVSANHQNVLIAYEPVWAIGTGLTPTLDEINQVHELIKNFDAKFRNFKVLYGGSVKSANSKEINDLNYVDGCLIGGASLKVDEFNTIIS
ncbi:triose-phosphate isomerase [Pelagibacteraceae bacterium]|nr:triose-phosphate isomerase [Pelagibacteraceae bacterium]